MQVRNLCTEAMKIIQEDISQTLAAPDLLIIPLQVQDREAGIQVQDRVRTAVQDPATQILVQDRVRTAVQDRVPAVMDGVSKDRINENQASLNEIDT